MGSKSRWGTARLHWNARRPLGVMWKSARHSKSSCGGSIEHETRATPAAALFLWIVSRYLARESSAPTPPIGRLHPRRRHAAELGGYMLAALRSASVTSLPSSMRRSGPERRTIASRYSGIFFSRPGLSWRCSDVMAGRDGHPLRVSRSFERALTVASTGCVGICSDLRRLQLTESTSRRGRTGSCRSPSRRLPVRCSCCRAVHSASAGRATSRSSLKERSRILSWWRGRGPSKDARRFSRR
mmetsp:Transcript_42405/g.135881  ORF Transcript_42405/g.135881 Transcript_42405/m.135881 type:complete len:242 (+) Transcript_42405:2829-3554(+)